MPERHAPRSVSRSAREISELLGPNPPAPDGHHRSEPISQGLPLESKTNTIAMTSAMLLKNGARFQSHAARRELVSRDEPRDVASSSVERISTTPRSVSRRLGTSDSRCVIARGMFALRIFHLLAGVGLGSNRSLKTIMR